MKLCVFSDIHGNDNALEISLDAMSKQNPDAYIFLGDLCGYYPNAGACFNLLRSLPNLIALRGNHDDYFIRIAAGDIKFERYYSDKYGDMYSHLAKNAHECDVVINWLKNLPTQLRIDAGRVHMVHGSLGDPLEGRLYPSSESDPSSFLIDDDAVEFVLMGHTHYPLDITRKTARFINPGSIGQPRQGGQPSFYVLDTESKEGFHVYFSYDRDSFLKTAQATSGISNYSLEVLCRG